jgi:hypothetical protein
VTLDRVDLSLYTHGQQKNLRAQENGVLPDVPEIREHAPHRQRAETEAGQQDRQGDVDFLSVPLVLADDSG